jgi:hypothetical protein
MYCLASYSKSFPFRTSGRGSQQLSLHAAHRARLNSLFSALPYKIRLTPLSVAFTHFDRGGRVFGSFVRPIRPIDFYFSSFHQLTNPSSSNSFVFSSIQIPGGVSGVPLSRSPRRLRVPARGFLLIREALTHEPASAHESPVTNHQSRLLRYASKLQTPCFPRAGYTMDASLPGPQEVPRWPPQNPAGV